MDPNFDAVRDYLTGLQDRICTAIEAVDGQARFGEDAWSRDPDGNTTHAGGGRTRILRQGAVVVFDLVQLRRQAAAQRGLAGQDCGQGAGGGQAWVH